MRKIAVFTGTRAEYGLLYWVMRGLQESAEVNCQIFVGGMHLSQEFGYTVDQIENDGFQITDRFEFLLSSDSAVAVCKSMGLALISAAEAFSRHKPELLVLLGDRFESLAVAQAAMISRIPIAHIHGGETTEGLIDEAVRHSITKMAHLHFTAAEPYRQRVIQLGEQPDKVFNSGAPGIDSIVRLPLLKREQLSDAIGFKLENAYFLVTYHPVTLISGGVSEALENLLAELDRYPNYQVVVSYPNADTDGRHLIEILKAYRDAQPNRVHLVRSLGQLRYLSLLKHCKAVLGNSSSGLIEAPTFGVPTLNIGERQKGRLSGDTVLNCDSTRISILNGLKKILSPEFLEASTEAVNPYGIGAASRMIVDELISHDLEGLVEKSFHDLEKDK